MQATEATDLFQHRFTVFSSIIQPIKLFLCFLTTYWLTLEMNKQTLKLWMIDARRKSMRSKLAEHQYCLRWGGYSHSSALCSAMRTSSKTRSDNRETTV